MPRWDGYGIGGNFATGEPTRATEISLGSKEIERYPEGENGSSSILIAVMGLLRNVRELLRVFTFVGELLEKLKEIFLCGLEYYERDL